MEALGQQISIPLVSYLYHDRIKKPSASRRRQPEEPTVPPQPSLPEQLP